MPYFIPFYQILFVYQVLFVYQILFVNNNPFYGSATPFIQPSSDGHLVVVKMLPWAFECRHPVDICFHSLGWTSGSDGGTLRLAWRSCRAAFHSGWAAHAPSNSYEGPMFPVSSPTLASVSYFLSSHPGGHEVVLSLVRICTCLMLMMLRIFSCACWLSDF